MGCGQSAEASRGGGAGLVNAPVTSPRPVNQAKPADPPLKPSPGSVAQPVKPVEQSPPKPTAPATPKPESLAPTKVAELTPVQTYVAVEPPAPAKPAEAPAPVVAPKTPASIPPAPVPVTQPPPVPLKVEGEDDHDLTGEMVAVVSASRDKTLRVWRLHDGHSVHHLLGHINKVASLIALGNGRVCSGSEDGDLKVWNIITGLCEKSICTNGNILSIAAAYGGRAVITGHGSGQDVKNGLQLWEFENTKQRKWGVENLPKIVQAVAFVPECEVVASAGNDEMVRLWSGATGEARSLLEGHTGWVRCLAPLLRGRLASGSDDGCVRIWDASAGVPLAVLDKAHGGSNMFGMCALPDGRLATAGGDKCVRLWALSEVDHKLTPTAEFSGHASAVYAVDAAVVPKADGSGTHIVLISGGHDNSVRVWDIDTRECRVCANDHLGWILNVSVAPLTY